jgi:hypothetical protein
VAAEKVISIFAGERKEALQIMTRHSFVLTQVGIAIFHNLGRGNWLC